MTGVRIAHVNKPMIIGVACGIAAFLIIIVGMMSGSGHTHSTAQASGAGRIAIPEGIYIPALFIILGLGIYCAFRESKVTGTYKTFGVYGRLRAYLFLDAVLLAVCSLAILPFGGFRDVTGGIFVTFLLFLAACAAACIIYAFTKSRCPAMLQDKLLVSMLISGLGVAMKISLFFVAIIWKLITPPEMVDENGNTIYVIDDTVYDGGGNKVGVIDPNDRNSYYRINS